MMATFLSSHFVNMSVLDNVRRKVKVSKNKKKSWNKFCDVKEIEDFLEEKRFEERIGWSESENQLFFQDTTTETEKPVKSKGNLTLKCHQSIGSFSSVPVPLTVNENKYPKKVKKFLEKKFEKKVKKVIARKSEDKHQSESNLEIKDPWAEDEEVDEDIKDLITYRDEITEKRTPNVPSHLFQKPSLLPAVEVPHAGASYNPTFEDHQDLLRKAVDVEEKRLKGELHLKRVLTDMFPSKAEAPTEKSILEEMSQGLFEDDKEEETQNESGFSLRNPPILAEDRLPKSRKRKRKELKEEAKRRAVEKLKKQRLHEIYRIPSIKSEIRKEKELSKKRELKNLERKVEKMYNPNTISAYKYEPQDIEVNLSEEITGSLRTVKADGNLLEDRYKSLQRRNLIEPRIKQKVKRKYKLKKQIKRSHRGLE